VNFAEVIRELKALYIECEDGPPARRSRLTETEVRRWSAWVGSRASLYDQIAFYLACGFHSSELTFTFCDWVINDLFGVITSKGEDRPNLFWAVYLAFDEGEYDHGSNRDEDPVEAYTRPMISRIIEGNNSN
jgi:hypothetical protein